MHNPVCRRMNDIPRIQHLPGSVQCLFLWEGCVQGSNIQCDQHWNKVKFLYHWTKVGKTIDLLYLAYPFHVCLEVYKTGTSWHLLVRGTRIPVFQPLQLRTLPSPKTVPLDPLEYFRRIMCYSIGSLPEINSWSQHWHCKSCAHTKMGVTFCSMTMKEKFHVHVKTAADCWTTNVVYFMECIKYTLQYIREMENALCIWLTGYWSNFNHQCVERPVAKLFTLLDHSHQDLSTTVIEKIHREDIGLMRRKETHWVETIWSLTLDGLNLNQSNMPLLIPLFIKRLYHR